MKIKFTFLFFFASQTLLMAQTRPTLLYFGDPMCSWCYGFSPEFSKVAESLSGQVDLKYIMGGLRPYGEETMADLGSFLHGHWEEVGHRSGQRFNFGILEDDTFIYNTEPACRAVVTMRHLKPEVEFNFFKAVQSAFYFENKDTNLPETFAKVASQFGVAEKTFLEKFNSEAMKAAVREDFKFSQELGVRGFPTVVLKKGEEYFLVSNGYDEAENVRKKINKILSE